MNPATAPLVTNAKSAFRSVIYKAPVKPKAFAANIVTMFERPAFAPAGRKGTAGKIRFSSRLSTRHSAPSRPKTQTFFVFVKSRSDCVESFFSVFNSDNNLVRNTRGGVPVF